MCYNVGINSHMMNLNQQPTAPLKSILSTNALASKKSLSSIVKDMKKVEGLSAYQRRLVKKTLYNLNTNPNAVVTSRQSKAIVGIMRDRGHLKSKFHHRLGAAIRQVQHSYKNTQTKEKDSEKTDQEDEPLSSHEQQKEERKKESKMRMLARERRDEEEMKKRGATYSAGNSGTVSANQKQSVHQEVQQAERDRNERKAIDMMID